MRQARPDGWYAPSEAAVAPPRNATSDALYAAARCPGRVPAGLYGQAVPWPERTSTDIARDHGRGDRAARISQSTPSGRSVANSSYTLLSRSPTQKNRVSAQRVLSAARCLTPSVHLMLSFSAI